MSRDARSIERLLRDIETSAGGTAGREAAKAELDVTIARMLSNDLKQLASDVDSAKIILGERMSDLTAKLSELRAALDGAAASSAAQANTLVSWTRIYVVATLAIVGLGIITLGYQIYSAPPRAERLVPGAPATGSSQPR